MIFTETSEGSWVLDEDDMIVAADGKRVSVAMSWTCLEVDLTMLAGVGPDGKPGKALAISDSGSGMRLTVPLKDDAVAWLVEHLQKPIGTDGETASPSA